MPETEPKHQTTEPVLEDGSERKQRQQLKYLEFVQLAALYVVVCLSSIYEYAKENSGPLKPGVQTVEGTVKTVIGPVYDKFHDVPFELLKFVDRKVDDSINELDRHVPTLVKQASFQARAVASEVQQAGVVGTAKNITINVYTKYEPTAKELYTKYEPVAERYVVLAWRSVNRLPLVHQVAQIVIPTASYWSGKYNWVVCYAAERGYTVALYAPLIPKERIAKVFEEPSVSSNGIAIGDESE